MQPGHTDLNRAVAASLAEAWDSGDITPTANYYRESGIEWRKIDLDQDGVDEAICSPSHAVFKGDKPHSVMGATGNGPCFLFRQYDGNWIQIADLSGETYWIDEQRFNDWPIIITDWDMGGHERGRKVLAFDGVAYRSVHQYSIAIDAE